MTDGWFAALRSDGAVARGSQRITVNSLDFGVGIAPAWFDHETLVIKDFDDRLYKLNVTTGERLLLTSHQVQEHAAGGGVWAYSFPPIIHTAVGRDGSIAEVYEHGGNNRDRSILLNGKEIHRGIVNNAMTEGGYVVWSRYEPREVWGRSPDGQIRKLADGLFGLPIVTPDGPWVLVMTHTELLLLPWGASDCQVIRTGNDNNFYPDALWVGGIILAVWNTHDGQPGLASIDITAAREPFPGASVPSPTPEPETMRLPEAVQQTIRAMWPKVAHLHAGSDNDRRTGTRIIIEQIVFSHPGQGYGWKASSPNNPPSKDAMSRQLDGKLYYVDLIDGTTRQLANLDGEMEDITGQHFIEVAGVNHLGAAPVPVPQPTGKHPYEGGDNDTGECDYVDRNGDTCRQPPNAAIHQVTTPTPGPNPTPVPQPGDDARLVRIEKDLGDLRMMLNELGGHLGAWRG